MMRIRLFLGIVAGALAVVATAVAARTLMTNIQVAHGAPALLLPGLLPPVMIGAAAALLGRIAYRNLFWRRYVAGVRRDLATTSTTAPDERRS